MNGCAIILVGYDLEQTIYALGAYDLLANMAFFKEKILVWNGSKCLYHHITSIGSSWAVVSGSNINHEFSGWQEGISALSEDTSNYNYIVFANDTVARSDSPPRKAYLLPRLALYLKLSKAYDVVGLIHDSPWLGQQNDLGPHKITSWICTGCFAISGAFLARLGAIVDNSIECSKYLSVCTAELLLSENTSAAFRQHIDDWLSNPSNGWNKAVPKPWPECEYQKLQKKALMLLNEMMLSVKIRDLGGILYEPPFESYTFIHKLLRLPSRIFEILANVF
jgi:hypothetical protein